MAVEEQVLEVHGADVDEAIEKGLQELGLDRSEVEVDVLDSGSSGFLGIGAREALVKLTVSTAGVIKPGEAIEQPAVDVKPGLPVEDKSSPISEDVLSPAEVETEEEFNEEEVALEIIENLLERLKFEASTSLQQTEPDDLTGEQRWVIEISGNELGMLIGTRGETLNAFQHVARLMTGHRIRQRPKFIVDVQGYRLKREKALSRLAERMAEKVVSRGRAMTLEPMPPNERRIIHISLRDDDRVYTESFGEGRRRKVRIYPSD